MKKVVIGCVLAGLIGILLGYVGAYFEYRNERDHGSTYAQWRGEWIGLPALPGMLMAGQLRPYDYQLTEAWMLDKHRIALLNGLCYLPLGLITMMRRKASNKGVVLIGDPLRGSPNAHP
jgi:hypothetical protein